MNRVSALVIEDDDEARLLLTSVMRNAGYRVFEAATATTGLEIAVARTPDLITLDLNLPDFDGVELCRRLRALTDAYLIIISGRVDEIDRLIGLEVGADDYLGKPFSTRELTARMTALFRRPRHLGNHGATHDMPEVIDGGAGLMVDTQRREVRVGDRELPLTRTEFDLLVVLVSRPGTVCERGQIVSAIWESDYVDSDHVVDVHVANLRRKLNQVGGRNWIHTVRGVGYRFDSVG